MYNPKPTSKRSKQNTALRVLFSNGLLEASKELSLFCAPIFLTGVLDFLLAIRKNKTGFHMSLGCFINLISKRRNAPGKIMLVSLVLIASTLSTSILYAQLHLGAKIEKGSRLNDFSDDDTLKVRALNYYSRRPGTPPEVSKRFAREAIALAQKLDFKEGEADAYRMLAKPFILESKGDSALIYYKKSYALFNELGHTLGKAFAQMGIATILSQSGQFVEAQKMFLSILETYEAAGYHRGIGGVYNAIGDMYLRQGEFELSIFNFEQSIKAHLQYSNSREIIRTYVSFAQAYEKMGRLEEALAQLEKGVKIEERRTIFYAPLFFSKGKIHAKMGDYEEAKKALLTSMDYAKRVGSVKGQIGAFNFLAENEFVFGNYEAAQSYALAALNLFDTNTVPDTRLKSVVINLLTKIEEKLGNYEQSLNYAIAAKAISDSLNKQQNLKTIAELQTIYETEKREQTILLLEAENMAAQFKVALITALGIVLSMIVGFIFWIVNKRKTEKKRLELESIKRELENYGVLIAEKDSFMTTLIERMRDMSRDLKTIESKKEVQTLIDSLHHNVQLTWDEEQLIQRIEQVNSGFFRQLEHQLGKLTKNEKRIASLVQMDLSNKEIAGILSISARSVSQARYRLKKRTKLGPEESLNDYLKAVHS